jgi:glutathione-regulated potassium-efflux system ancillary protein KefG
MKSILMLFAHPVAEKSRVQRALLREAASMPNVTLRDLYEAYPDFNIDIEAEKSLLKTHEIVLWQHPFYWYSCPALLKQWIDLVLEYGWAYGPGGNALEGKLITNVVSTGGPEAVYRHDGRNRFTVRQYLAPFEQTAMLCKMTYIDPFLVQGTHKLTEDLILAETARYGEWLKGLSHG